MRVTTGGGGCKRGTSDDEGGREGGRWRVKEVRVSVATRGRRVQKTYCVDDDNGRNDGGEGGFRKYIMTRVKKNTQKILQYC